MANPRAGDNLTDSLIEHAREAFDAIGAELAERMRAMVRVPVGRQGNAVVRSLPGEPPRLEDGDYEASFGHQTTVTGDVIRTEAGTTHERGPWFEGGTATMKPRPHVSVVHEEFKSEAPERIAEALSPQPQTTGV